MPVRPLGTHRFRQTDRLLFDTNVWLFLYSPQYGPNDNRVRIYSGAAKSALAAQSTIFIDVLVLSEFINTWARFTYNKLPASTKPKDFKTYRNSSAFKPVAKSIADACRRILGYATRIDSEFASLNLDNALANYEAGRADFNDYVLAELCTKNELTLVTDDADLKGRNLNILTENRRLLTSS
jgi:predicted nucleic acid-binding protein